MDDLNNNGNQNNTGFGSVQNLYGDLNSNPSIQTNSNIPIASTPVIPQDINTMPVSATPLVENIAPVESTPVDTSSSLLNSLSENTSVVPDINTTPEVIPQNGSDISTSASDTVSTEFATSVMPNGITSVDSNLDSFSTSEDSLPQAESVSSLDTSTPVVSEVNTIPEMMSSVNTSSSGSVPLEVGASTEFTATPVATEMTTAAPDVGTPSVESNTSENAWANALPKNLSEPISTVVEDISKENENVETQKLEEGKSEEKGSNAIVIILIVLIVALLAGIGYLVYKIFLS